MYCEVVQHILIRWVTTYNYTAEVVRSILSFSILWMILYNNVLQYLCHSKAMILEQKL